MVNERLTRETCSSHAWQFHSKNWLLEMPFQQTFVGLQDVFNVTIFLLPRPLEDVLKIFWRRLEDILQDVLKTSWKKKNIYSKDVLKTCLEDVLKTSCKQTKCLLGISASKKSKCVTNKSIFHKSISDESKANPKCIN